MFMKIYKIKQCLMYIYKITNKINNMIYIGQTKRPYEKSKSYYGSGKKIQGEIYLHGKENFTKEILSTCDSIEELDKQEEFWINFYDSANPEKGYNIRYGGIYANFNEEFKINMSKSTTGIKNHMFGKKHKAESIKKMSDSKIGDKNPMFGKNISVESKEKISNSLKGLIRSEETIAKMKLSAKNRIYHKQICPHCGVEGYNNMKRYHFDKCKYKNV